MIVKSCFRWFMDFPKRLAQIRKQQGLTQTVLARKADISLIQIRRYEGGHSQPTLELIRKLSIALGVTTDMLIFGKDERGPDDDLRLQFEAISRFEPDEKRLVKEILDGLILKREAQRWGPVHKDKSA